MYTEITFNNIHNIMSYQVISFGHISYIYLIYSHDLSDGLGEFTVNIGNTDIQTVWIALLLIVTAMSILNFGSKSHLSVSLTMTRSTSNYLLK